MLDVFLSYAREDEPKARLLATVLEARGWSVWWDRHIPRGKDFNAYIQQQLDAAHCIVVLWSKASLASQFVRDEATEGLNGRLVPALIEAVRQPLGFRQLQAADLSDWHGQPRSRRVESARRLDTRNRCSVAPAHRKPAPPDSQPLPDHPRHGQAALPSINRRKVRRGKRKSPVGHQPSRALERKRTARALPARATRTGRSPRCRNGSGSASSLTRFEAPVGGSGHRYRRAGDYLLAARFGRAGTKGPAESSTLEHAEPGAPGIHRDPRWHVQDGQRQEERQPGGRR